MNDEEVSDNYGEYEEEDDDNLEVFENKNIIR